MEGRLDVETSNRPCGRISRSLAFAAMRKGEARMRRSKGPKPLRRTPLSDSPARRETPTVLNLSNRRIRTRMYGGVGGEESRGSPLSRSVICPSGALLTGVSSPLCKNISVFVPPKSPLELFASHPTQGACHDRQERGVGCGGRGSVLRAMGSQGWSKDL